MPGSPYLLPAVALVVLLAIALAVVFWLRGRRRRKAAELPPPPPEDRQVLPERERIRVELPPPPAPVRERFEGKPAPKDLSEGLSRTREGFVGRLRSLLGGRALDSKVVEELEELLFGADLGVKTAQSLLARLATALEKREVTDEPGLIALLKKDLRARLGEAPPALALGNGNGVPKPFVIMVVGVNGVGKTTTIGKLALQAKAGAFGGPRTVLLGAADTFRAAATEQLTIWANRAGAEIVANKEGTDPSAVAFDAARAALARGVDVLIVDTAGRLHTKANLMEELKKVKRVIGREIPGAPHEVLLVVDATTGQNALNQAKEFKEGVGVTGVVLTKLDGTAKGGIVVGIKDELSLPVRWIGIGEGVEDLRPFDPDAFVEALFR